MHSFLCCFEFMIGGCWFPIYGDDRKFPFKLNLRVGFFLSESVEIEWVNNITGSMSIWPKQRWNDWDFRNTGLIEMSPATRLIHPYLACSQQRWRPRGHSPVCWEDMFIPPPESALETSGLGTMACPDILPQNPGKRSQNNSWDPISTQDSLPLMPLRRGNIFSHLDYSPSWK